MNIQRIEPEDPRFEKAIIDQRGVYIVEEDSFAF